MSKLLGKSYILRKSSRKDKRLVLIKPDGKSINFGAKKGSTYIDHGDRKKRKNYIARHSKLKEDWSNINAGSLSRYILWEKKNLSDAIESYEKRFGITIIVT